MIDFNDALVERMLDAMDPPPARTLIMEGNPDHADAFPTANNPMWTGLISSEDHRFSYEALQDAIQKIWNQSYVVTFNNCTFE